MSKVFRHSSTSNFSESFPKVYGLKLTHSRRVVAMFARNRFFKTSRRDKIKINTRPLSCRVETCYNKVRYILYSITRAVLNQSRI